MHLNLENRHEGLLCEGKIYTCMHACVHACIHTYTSAYISRQLYGRRNNHIGNLFFPKYRNTKSTIFLKKKILFIPKVFIKKIHINVRF